MTVTTRQAWVGLLILFVVAILVLAATVYWQHIMHVNVLHLLAFLPQPTGQGC
jgi:hypothetical protein